MHACICYTRSHFNEDLISGRICRLHMYMYAVRGQNADYDHFSASGSLDPFCRINSIGRKIQ